MRERTALRRRILSSHDHLEQERPLQVPVEQEEFLEPSFVIVRWGSGVKASMGATRKPR
jgi:hypothetical protein